MERSRWGLALLAGLVALLVGLWLAADRPPRLPADGDHGLEQPESACLGCHGYGQRHPRPPTHPLRDDCFSCHADAKGKLHRRLEAPTALPNGWPADPRLAGKATQ